MGVSRSAIWKHIQNLRDAGYEIAATPHLGYRYMTSPDLILPEEIHYHLRSRMMGRRISSLRSVDSTNRVALEWGAQKMAEGHAIFAEEQTAGRGRRGRRWVSPKGQGLYFSVFLKPDLEIQEVSKVTLAAAVAVAEALKTQMGIPTEIRWPNDVLVKGRKICGILTEINAEADQIQFAVLGVGINVNGTSKDLPEGATSLRQETGRRWDRNLLAARILEHLEQRIDQVKRSQWKALLRDWMSLSKISGKKIKVATLHETIEGRALGVDAGGALLVQSRDGTQHRILSGDVVLCR